MYVYLVIKMLLDSVEYSAKQMVLLISAKLEKWRCKQFRSNNVIPGTASITQETKVGNKFIWDTSPDVQTHEFRDFREFDSYNYGPLRLYNFRAASELIKRMRYIALLEHPMIYYSV